MGIRTHLKLTVNGPTCSLGSFKNLHSEIYLLNYECIGKCYFDDIEEEIFDQLEDGLYFEEMTSNGEITVGTLIKLSELIKTAEETCWKDVPLDDIVKTLQQALQENIITLDDYIQFEAF